MLGEQRARPLEGAFAECRAEYDGSVDRCGLALLTLSLVTTACAERVIDFTACRDGFLEAGEVCFSEATVPLRSDIEPVALRVADFDGDGHQDALVLGTMASGPVAGQLLPGDGEGGLGPVLDTSLYGCSAHPVPGDIDGDAAADLLVSTCTPSILVFTGSPQGFSSGKNVETGASTRTSGIIDVDDDGNNDIILLGTDAAEHATLSVALGDGAAGFAAPELSPLPAITEGFEPTGFGMGDIDADGTLDAVLVDPAATGGYALARGRGDGSFEPPVAVLADFAPGGARLHDVDDDGHLDVLLRPTEPNEIALAQGDGTGTFVEVARTSLPEDDEISLSLLDDFDGDDTLDVLLIHPDRPVVDIWLGNRDGSFENPTAIETGGVAEQLGIADLNEDGARDLVIGAFAEGGIRVVLARP